MTFLRSDSFFTVNVYFHSCLFLLCECNILPVICFVFVFVLHIEIWSPCPIWWPSLSTRPTACRDWLHVVGASGPCWHLFDLSMYTRAAGLGEKQRGEGSCCSGSRSLSPRLCHQHPLPWPHVLLVQFVQKGNPVCCQVDIYLQEWISGSAL